MNKFRNLDGVVHRTCSSHHTNYQDYRENLAGDFNHRCAYCDIRDDLVADFEIDHFIPRKVFKDIDNSLDTNYNNLVYSCKKCNRAKSSKYSGPLTKGMLENQFFYDPTKVNFNDIFYRNKFGVILSDDLKGKKIIEYLRLQNPIYAFGWLIDYLDKIIEELNFVTHPNLNIQNNILRLQNNLLNCRIELNKIFTANYNLLK